MAGFEKLERIVVIPVRYTTRGNLSIFTGRGDGIRDNLVVREGGPESNPVITGSSQKGVSRNIIEALFTRASQMAERDEEKERLKVCVPPTCKGQRYKVDEKGTPVSDNKGKPVLEDDYIPENRLDPKNCEERILRGEKPCPVCQMFGNTRMKGRVIFHDAKAEGEIRPIERTHVAIDRGSGTQSRGALMKLETVPSRVTFSGSIVLVNPDDWMVGAIIETLKLLPYIGVGAKTTSGYGELCVEIGPLEFPLPDPRDTRSPEKYQEDCIREWRELIKLELSEEGSDKGVSRSEV